MTYTTQLYPTGEWVPLESIESDFSTNQPAQWLQTAVLCALPYIVCN